MGYVVQSTKTINPFLQIICPCVEFTLLILVVPCMCVSVCGHICMNACFLQAIKVEDACELTLHLHSCFQIKAKNYDKVEKVSVHLSPGS